MYRLSPEEEKEILTNESNQDNLIAYKNIIKDFFYNCKTEDRISNNLEKEKRSYEENYLDEYFNLNDDRRAFYKIDNDILADSEGYQTYRNFLSSASSYKLIELAKKLNCDVGILVDILYKYETFSTNSFMLNSNTYKLFKFLTKNDIFKQEYIDKINSRKVKKDDNLYVCISRNPIDYLFCSTNQPFSSCEDLESDYEGAFYMGLGSLFLDPNRFIMFLTKGRYKRYEIKAYSFKHLSYKQRSWGLIDKQNRLVTVRSYPDEKLDFNQFLADLKYNTVYNHEFTESKFSFEKPRFLDNSISMIYLDMIGVDYDKDTMWYYNGGLTGCISRDFNWTGGFYDIGCFEDLEGGMICEHCEDMVDSLEEYEVDRDYISICRSCAEDLISCEFCNCLSFSNNGFVTDVETDEGFRLMCEDCMSEYYVCENCNRIILNNSNNYDDMIYCDDCYDELDMEETG